MLWLLSRKDLEMVYPFFLLRSHLRCFLKVSYISIFKYNLTNLRKLHKKFWKFTSILEIWLLENLTSQTTLCSTHNHRDSQLSGNKWRSKRHFLFWAQIKTFIPWLLLGHPEDWNWSSKMDGQEISELIEKSLGTSLTIHITDF